MEGDRLDQEIDENYDFFRRNLGGYLVDHADQFALLRSRSLVGFYGGVKEADRAGREAFPDGIFSIQIVRQEPIDLGFFSHAGS